MEKERKITLTILSNNIVNESQLLAEHGISVLINIQKEDKSEYFLLDTSQTSSTLLYNMDVMNIDISRFKISAIILSHGHYDHTGGLKGLLEKSKNKIPIVGHPDVFAQRISYVGGFRAVSCPYTKEEIRIAGGDLLLTKDPVKINEYLETTGSVPRENKFEKNPFFRKISNNSWENDEVDDDLSVIINIDQNSFFLLCGCCHAGIINTLEWIKKNTGKQKLVGLMGGLHLVGANKERIDFTIRELKKWKPEIIIPLHCSGLESTYYLKSTFGEKVKLLACGDSWIL